MKGSMTASTTSRPFEKSRTQAIYVVYEGMRPTKEDLHALRRETKCDVVLMPIQSIKASFDKADPHQVLQKLEAPYVTRTDPYLEQNPIDDPNWFFGHQDLLDSLSHSIRQGVHVGIFGLRKIGKTSLAKQLRQQLVDIPSAWIDCQDMALDPEYYFDEIARKLEANASAGRIERQTDFTGGPGRFKTRILSLFDDWQSRGRAEPFSVIFDEVDKLFVNRNRNENADALGVYAYVFRAVRSLAQQHRCLTVTAIAHRAEVNRQNFLSKEIGDNPMFNSFREVHLDLLSATDSSILIHDLGRWKDIEWDSGAAQQAYLYCGGHPYVTRLFASKACGEGRLKEVTATRAGETAEGILSSFRRNQLGAYFSGSIWDELRQRERELLVQIGRTDHMSEPAALPPGSDGDLSHLENLRLVRFEDDRLHLPGTFFKAWLERKSLA